MTTSSRSTIIYHNLQSDGDHGDSMVGTDEYNEVVRLAIEAARAGITYKEQAGVQGRLRHAQEYLESNKTDKVVFHSASEQTDEDCTDCPEIFSVNIDFIRLQHETALSIYTDALKSRGNDYASIEPTPIPSTSAPTGDLIETNAFNAVMRDLTASVPLNGEDEDGAEYLYGIQYLEEMLGTDVGLAALEEIVTKQKTIANSKLNASASRKSINAKTMVDDKLTESNYDIELKEFASSVFWNDYGVMFAPFKKTIDTTEITKNGKLKEAVKEVWAFENIHPLNHFYSPSTTYADMGDYEGDMVFMSKNDLRRISSGGAVQSAIDEVIEDFDSFRNIHGITTYDDHQYSEFNQVIPCIRVFMQLGTEEAKALFDDSEVTSKQATHTVELLIAGETHLLYKAIYPRYVNLSPYRKMSFNMPTHSSISSGRGLYSLCRTGQEIVDNALIGLLGEVASSSQYVMEINSDKLVEPDEIDDDLAADRPVIRTKGTGSYAAYGGNDRALHITAIPDSIGKFTSALLTGVELIERVGFSAFALGQGNFSNVRSTGQSGILQVNGNKRFAKMLSLQEFFVESPIIEYIWVAESIETNDLAIIVDATVRVTSYSGFLEKEEKAEQVGLFMQNVVGFLNARTTMNESGTDTSFYDSLLRQYVEANGYDVSTLNIGADPSEVMASTGAPVNQSVPIDASDGRYNIPPNINEVI